MGVWGEGWGIRAFTLTSIMSDFGSSRRSVRFKDPIYGGLAVSRDTEEGKIGVPVIKSHPIYHVIDVHVSYVGSDVICSCLFHEIPNLHSMQ